AEGADAAADGVVKRRIGEAPIVLSIEIDAMQLQLEKVVAVTSRIEHDTGLFVDFHERRRLVRRGRGDRRNQPAIEVVEIEVIPVVPLQLADESPAVLEKADAW